MLDAMLTDEQLRKAFTDTNVAEPLCEGWPGLERFAREVERLVEEANKPFDKRYGAMCHICKTMQPLANLELTGGSMAGFRCRGGCA